MNQPRPAQAHRRKIAGALVAVGAALVCWWVRPDDPVEVLVTKRVPVAPAAKLSVVAPEKSQELHVKRQELAHDGAQSIHAAITPQAMDHEQERPHPHPIDDARRRIYRENNLSFAMMGAMNVGDYLGLRALVEEYRMAYPEDEHQLHEGYALVADCMERLTSELQTEAREYWKNNRASMVRRFIRRHCLEKPVVSG